MTLALQVSLCPSTQKSGVVCGQRAKQRLKEKEGKVNTRYHTTDLQCGCMSMVNISIVASYRKNGTWYAQA
jgi:hypothetical protein